MRADESVFQVVEPSGSWTEVTRKECQQLLDSKQIVHYHSYRSGNHYVIAYRRVS